MSAIGTTVKPTQREAYPHLAVTSNECRHIRKRHGAGVAARARRNAPASGRPMLPSTRPATGSIRREVALDRGDSPSDHAEDTLECRLEFGVRQDPRLRDLAGIEIQ